MRLTFLSALAALFLCVGPVVAQAPPTITLLPTSTSVTLSWDKPVTGDPVTGYELVFANTVQTGDGVAGQQLKTVPINDPNATTFEVPVSLMPAVTVREFYASLRAVSNTLKSVHSNALLFRRATPPGAPGNFRGVVAEGQASLGKLESGDVTAGSLTLTSGGSIHAIVPSGSNSLSSSLTADAGSGLRLSSHSPRGKSASLTSFPSPK